MRARRVKIGLLAAALAGALLGSLSLGWARAHAPARGANPLEGHLLAESVGFDGRVAERLEAGSYAYLRVARDGAGDAWVVGMRPRARVGDRVHVDAMGRAEDFKSNRLGRRFDELWFASVKILD
jgi:hypothetical protein